MHAKKCCSAPRPSQVEAKLREQRGRCDEHDNQLPCNMCTQGVGACASCGSANQETGRKAREFCVRCRTKKLTQPSEEQVCFPPLFKVGLCHMLLLSAT